MRPINGRCAMTPEEKNARRRELDADPFHRALTRKTAKKWRDRNREKLNARRREKYAQDPESARRKAKAWRDRNPEKRKAAWKKWADANRDRLRARDAARSKTQKEKERRKRMIEERRKRRASDPEYREHIRAVKRESYHRNKGRANGLRWYLKYLLIPRWRRIKDDEDEARYLARCGERTRNLYGLWKSGAYGALERLTGEGV